jgi:SMC interacting uncharacterized protein involved in chromosome segregation
VIEMTDGVCYKEGEIATLQAKVENLNRRIDNHKEWIEKVEDKMSEEFKAVAKKQDRITILIISLLATGLLNLALLFAKQ